MSPVAGQLDFNFDVRALYLIPMFMFHHLFDVVATTLVLLRQAYFSKTKVELRSEDLDESLASSSKVRIIEISLLIIHA